MYDCVCLKRERWFETVQKFLDSTDLIVPEWEGELVVWPYDIRVYSYATPVEDASLWNSLKNFAADTAGMLRVYDTNPQVPTMAWGYHADLIGVSLPKRDELLARLAIRPDITEEVAVDVYRRMAAEEGWSQAPMRLEIREWIRRIVVPKAYKPQPGLQAGACYSCRLVTKTYRHECKSCRASQTVWPPPERLVGTDTTAVHVGFRRLWSKPFTFPAFKFKSQDCVYTQSGRAPPAAHLSHKSKAGGKKCPKKITHYSQFVDWHKRQHTDFSVRGRLCGPMFNHCEPVVYPRGEATACAAFCVRLASERLHKATYELYDAAYRLMAPDVIRLAPEPKPYFLSHYKGTKLSKMLDAKNEVDSGWYGYDKQDATVYSYYTRNSKRTVSVVRVKMSGFTKAEKGYSDEYEFDYFWVDKETQKPRFICAPNAMALLLLGPYTHRQTKWLSEKYTWRDRMFYAGCSTPLEMNSWLNSTLSIAGGFVSICDDISAMDSNHSEPSFDFHDRIRRLQFPDLSELVEGMFQGETVLKVRIGSMCGFVSFVNASGVSDTSYKNSLICLAVRAIAVASMVYGYASLVADPQMVAKVMHVLTFTFQAASGDDGLVRLPAKILGVSVTDARAIREYRAAWAAAGFSVKVAVVAEHRWRMATFLAQRPVWNGSGYEWAPEPARRLRKIFWQIDNFTHPFAWGRGVATQVLQQGKCQPVLSLICNWYLERTTGPIATIPEEAHNPMASFISQGEIDDRTMAEFYTDYSVDAQDLFALRSLLNASATVTIDVSCHLLDRLLCEES